MYEDYSPGGKKALQIHTLFLPPQTHFVTALVTILLKRTMKRTLQVFFVASIIIYELLLQHRKACHQGSLEIYFTIDETKESNDMVET